eukprot:COSAG01_NODE_35842_length_525_cov_29.434272_1_plen_63_part_10
MGPLRRASREALRPRVRGRLSASTLPPGKILRSSHPPAVGVGEHTHAHPLFPVRSSLVHVAIV